MSLALLAGQGFRVPEAVCVTTEAYRIFVDKTGIGERIQLELNRKDPADMRWEELWDSALRIRNLFLATPMDEELEGHLHGVINDKFKDVPVAVRSSAPEEDAASTSFAGLHESFINISGPEAIIDRIRLVWASLWSDRALLYRQELGLLTGKSAMAVVVQKVIPGRCSGIFFTRSPSDIKKGIIEAVHGLNQALVDGLIEPDRWFVDREDGRILAFPARRTSYIPGSGKDMELKSLPSDLRKKQPLAEPEVRRIHETGLAIEKYYGRPQDIEWTFRDDELFILQARPISTVAVDDQEDMRPWYLSLHRSLTNLKKLRAKIETKLLPAMVEEADLLNRVNFEHLTNKELADEIESRNDLKVKWTDVYWRDFIPFAHGMRLFGEVYNDTVRPENPYEFVDLLVHVPLQSVERNRKLQELADKVRDNGDLRRQLEDGADGGFGDHEFVLMFNDFISRYGDLSCSLGLDDYCRNQTGTLLSVIVEIADVSPGYRGENKPDSDALLENYLRSFPAEKSEEAKDILEIGRASYRLRDDDNIYLGRIEREVARALEEAHRRLEDSARISKGDKVEISECLKTLRDPQYLPQIRKSDIGSRETTLKNLADARQLIGQPAGPGVARGKARIVRSSADLGKIRKGEVLVCDSIEPNMTFVVPIVAAIVERRGGMLIHGAIIAREYGIPCVTGIPDAVELIDSGDELNVDGHLGIVTVLSKKE